MKHSTVEDDLHDDNIETEIPKMYLKVQSLIEFDTFVITHGPFTSVDSGKYMRTHDLYIIFHNMDKYKKYIHMYLYIELYIYK